jgi:glutamine synthetase
MHTNISLSKDGVNMFYDAGGKHNMSAVSQKFITGVLAYANDICLIMNPSVNA